MLRNRWSPRRKACSTVIGSPRYRRTAYSVMAPVTMLVRITEMAKVAINERTRSPKSTVGRVVEGTPKKPPPGETVPKMAYETTAPSAPVAAPRAR